MRSSLAAPVIKNSLTLMSKKKSRSSKTKKLILFVVLACTAWTSPILAQKDASVERKINILLAKMTLAEKLGQLQQLPGDSQGNARPEQIELARKGLLGSTLNVRGAKF